LSIPQNYHQVVIMKIRIIIGVLIAMLLGASSITQAADSDVTFLDRTKVDEAFSKAQPLLVNAHYKVIAGRRVEPGVAELHEHDTDVFYVTEGSATFVTGGTLVDSKTESPGEIRAKSVAGGTTRHLKKGDVIVIPKGTPHWFTEVSGTFLYFVVKVTE